MSMIGEFGEFLEQYKVVGLAVAFVIGGAANNLVQAVVNDIVMPVVSVLIRGGAWETATATIGPFTVPWGPFLDALVDFLIIAALVFFVSKAVKSAEGKKTTGKRGGKKG